MKSAYKRPSGDSSLSSVTNLREGGSDGLLDSDGLQVLHLLLLQVQVKIHPGPR